MPSGSGDPAPRLARMAAKAGRLTQDSTAAEATLPRDWRLMGVVRGPREVRSSVPLVHERSSTPG